MFTIPANKKAFLFDMDGTLVNTEPLGLEVFMALFAENGVDLTDDEKILFTKVWRRDGTEIKEDDYLATLATKYGIVTPSKDFIKEFYAKYKQALITASELPNVSSFLRQAKERGITLALVTSSKREQAIAILDFHKWSQLFTLIVSEEDIEHFKPHPEPYLLAMQKLSLTPDDCVVFEDAKNGAIAGNRAGMFVVGLRAGNEDRQDLEAADAVVQSFADLVL